MVTKEDIEGFLDRLEVDGATHSEIEPGIWVVKPGGALDFDVVVHYSPPVVLLRVKVMDLPKQNGALATLSRRLLELNATRPRCTDRTAFEGDSIVLTEALELVAPRLRRIPGRVRKHDPGAGVAPARARAVPRGTLTHGHLRSPSHAARVPTSTT